MLSLVPPLRAESCHGAGLAERRLGGWRAGDGFGTSPSGRLPLGFLSGVDQKRMTTCTDMPTRETLKGKPDAMPGLPHCH